MKINIKNLKGQVFTIDIEPSQNVGQLKQVIQLEKGFPVDDQKIIFKGKTISNQDTIEQMGISPKDFLVIMVKKPAAKPAPKPEEKQEVKKEEQPKKEEAVKGEKPAVAQNGERAAKVTQLMSMGFTKQQCEEALSAAFNDSDRAVEYLINGIPAQPQQGLGDNNGMAIPMSPQELALVARVREQVRDDPDSLPDILAQLAQNSPNLYALIAQHPQEFEEMVMGDDGVEMDIESEGDQGGIVVSEAQEQAIARLANLGFSKIEAAQAYMACDKNEQMAANLLFERLANGDIDQVQPGQEQDQDEDDLFN